MEIMHFARLVPEKAAICGDKTVMRVRDYGIGSWKSISWNEFDRDVNRCAKALIEQSILEKDRVGIFSQNRAECLIAEYAIYSNRAVSVPMYATSTTAQIEYIINDSGMHVLFVGDQYQYDRAYEAQRTCKGLKQIVIFNPDVRLALTDVHTMYFSEFLQSGLLSKSEAELETRRNNANDEDLANIMYTSGTTGEPKGVILTHAMFLEAMRVHDKKLTAIGDNEVSLCFLPLTHIFEKAWSHFCLHKDMRIDINTRPTDIQMVLKEVEPTCMCNVPRFWEKIYEGIQDAINAKPKIVRTLFNEGVRVGRKYHIDLIRKHKPVPFSLKLRYQFFDKTLFRTVRKTVGLQNAKILPVAGARLSNDLCLFFRSIGLPLYYGYGLTESTATVSAFDEFGYRVGSVGNVIDGLEVKISEEGEILLKGKTITPGYYKKPEETAACLTADGFFRTGDAGQLDGEFLMITERIKDLYKTSNGKYIAPQKIETALCEDRYIDMVAVIGNEQKFVSALIVPTYDKMPELCKQLGVEFTTPIAVLQDERIHNFFEERIHKMQKHMASYEQVRRFILLDQAFSMANGELTDTLKIRRKVVAEHYAVEIASMY
ncbi:MAG TPA: long-chain fatty acid--CoA ligase [Bacteroidales bacterium]|nr:long-chain fatty acid--CoA ligase [Bacteroidales bacterium]